VTFVAPAVAAASPPASGARVVLVPRAAVVTRDGASQVFTIIGDVVKPTPVTLGPTRQDQVVVTGGLSGEETIVARPPDSLKSGDRVRLKST
jgi:multidrug efflux pump subunit AcrA (membrane-fusion protein)